MTEFTADIQKQHWRTYPQSVGIWLVMPQEIVFSLPVGEVVRPIRVVHMTFAMDLNQGDFRPNC